VKVIDQLGTPSPIGLDFSPDNKYLISGNVEKTIKLWDGSTVQ